MKVKSLMNAVARRLRTEKDLKEYNIVVRIYNEYKVPTYYELKQVRGCKHPFVTYGSLVFDVDKMAFPSGCKERR